MSTRSQKDLRRQSRSRLPCIVKKGASAPLGATVCGGGVNFSVFSKSATLVELLLFDEENAAQPTTIIPLDARRHRTYHYWHVFVPDLKPGQIYAYRAHGPFAPEVTSSSALSPRSM
jgi:isoamylase